MSFEDYNMDLPRFDYSSAPKMPMPRSSNPDGVSLGTGLASNKMDMLGQMPGANRGFSSAMRMGGKALPLFGGAYTGYQTYQNNPANLTGMGPALHGMSTGVASALTPTPLGLADAVSGNRLGNSIEDMSGSFLSNFFGSKE